MDDLVAFLRARLVDERAEAEKQPDDEDYGLDPWVVRWEETGEWNSYPYVRIAKARVLREVEAKRRIVAQWELHEALDRETFEAEGEYARSLVSLRAAYWDACRELASVYADHPDYRPEWAPIA